MNGHKTRSIANAQIIFEAKQLLPENRQHHLISAKWGTANNAKRKTNECK